MTPREHCQVEAAPPGSNRYYALLNAAERNRHALLVLYAFENEVTGLAAPQLGPEVRRAKLGWWLEELDRLGGRRPRHPVTLAASEADLPIERLVGMAAGAFTRCATLDFQNAQSTVQLCEESGAPLARLGAELCGVSETTSLDAAARIGAGAQLLDWLVTHGRESPCSSHLAETAEVLLAGGEAALAGEDRYRLLSQLTLAALYRDGARRMRTSAPPRPLAAWIPLQRLWRAWRLARRERALWAATRRTPRE